MRALLLILFVVAPLLGAASITLPWSRGARVALGLAAVAATIGLFVVLLVVLFSHVGGGGWE